MLHHIHKSLGPAPAAAQEWRLQPGRRSASYSTAQEAAAAERSRTAAELAAALLLAGAAPLLLFSGPLGSTHHVPGAGGGGLMAGSAVTAVACVMGVLSPACFHRAMSLLPGVLSMGECSLAVQGALLAMAGTGGALRHLPRFAVDVWRVVGRNAAVPDAGFGPGSVDACCTLFDYIFLLVSLSLLISVCMPCVVSGRSTMFARAPAVVVMLAACLAMGLLALWTLMVFLPAVPGRRWLLGYWCALLAAVLPLMRLAARSAMVPQVCAAAAAPGHWRRVWCLMCFRPRARQCMHQPRPKACPCPHARY